MRHPNFITTHTSYFMLLTSDFVSFDEVHDRAVELVGALDEESVAAARDGAQLGAGDEGGEVVRVFGRHDLVGVARDDERRRPDLRDAARGVEADGGFELPPVDVLGYGALGAQGADARGLGALAL